MAYKNKDDRIKYDKEYYLRVKKEKYIPHPIIKKTREEKLYTAKTWRFKNKDKVKKTAKLSWEKHKEQRKLDNKKWTENNKEWVKEYHKKYQVGYYLKNKVKIDLKNKNYNRTHQKEIVKNVQRYTFKNKDKVSKYQSEYEQTTKGKYRQLICRAKKFSDGMDITIDKFREIISEECYYCGENNKPRGIDRVNNEIGYLKTNSVSCCKLCNFMKKALTKEEFLTHIEKIYNFNI